MKSVSISDPQHHWQEACSLRKWPGRIVAA
jgi:hypothetical protein